MRCHTQFTPFFKSHIHGSFQRGIILPVVRLGEQNRYIFAYVYIFIVNMTVTLHYLIAVLINK